VILESSRESDIQDCRMRGQEQPCPAIQAEPALVCSRRLAEHLHHQSVKLPPGKTRGSRHYIYSPRILRRIESAAEPADGIGISNYGSRPHLRFLPPTFYFLLSDPS
jgi:hypothetical protein